MKNTKTQAVAPVFWSLSGEKMEEKTLFLMNMSNYAGDLKRFGERWEDVLKFTDKHKLDGIELIRYDDQYLNDLPKGILKGYHMKYFPTWLEFYRGDQTKLADLFESREAVRAYYGGETGEVLVGTFRDEYQRAVNLGAKYMVYHVAHVTTEHSFTWNFDYSDEEIFTATTDLVNKAFNVNSPVELLFENLWWPGLTMLEKEQALAFMESIHYKNKGIMLDLGHLMITNREITTSSEAVDYILECLEKMGELKKWIKGIHINMSLSGEYLKEDHTDKYLQIKAFEDPIERYIKTIEHIKQIDRHLPFDNPRVNEIFEKIKPRYVVYEVLAKTIEQLEEYISKQNKALKG